jgi:hypothetical protein
MVSSDQRHLGIHFKIGRLPNKSGRFGVSVANFFFPFDSLLNSLSQLKNKRIIKQNSMEKQYKYLGYFLLLFIPLLFAGFYKTYIGQFPNFGEKIDAFIHIHAFIASVWIFILIVQPLLILNRKYAWHRTVGKLSYLVFPLLILSFVPQLIKTINHGDIRNLFFPLADSFLLIAFYSLAIYHRKTSGKHMRYMIATSLVFLGPTVGRIGPLLLGWSEMLTQNIQYTIIYTVLIGLILYDRTHQKRFIPYLIVIPFFCIHQLVYYLIFL